MLSNEGKNNLEMLKKLANKTWGTNLKIIKTTIRDAPFDTFVFNMLIYEQYEVLLEYEKGTFSTSIKINGKFVFLDQLTDKNVVYGFDSLIPENITLNFNTLDETLKVINGT